MGDKIDNSFCTTPSDRTGYAPLIAYVLTCLIQYGAAGLAETSLWAVDSWSLLSPTPAYLLIAVSVVVGLSVWMWAARSSSAAAVDVEWNIHRTSYLIVVATLALFGGAVFVLLRARAHFLGDGYGLLALLGEGSPIMLQVRELGESLAHIWTMSLSGAEGKAGALLSYQIVSVSAGCLFIALTGVYALRLFERRMDSLLFTAGVISGGYMLLFFGYVENYSLLSVAVLVFVLQGLLVLTGKAPRWSAIPVAIIGMVLHSAALVVVPAAIYSVLPRSKTRRGQSRRHGRTYGLIFAVLLVVAVVLGWYAKSQVLALEYLTVPLFSNRFTVEGYTLFSVRHLQDMANLIFITVPMIVVLMSAVPIGVVLKQFQNRDIRFIAILTASALGAAFLLDPKLGMPRDWDLFAFVGIVLAPSLLYLILRYSSDRRLALSAVALSVAVGITSLVPRAYVQSRPMLSVQQFERYAELDPDRNRYTGPILRDFYLEHGDSLKAASVADIWKDRYPEIELLGEAERMIRDGRLEEAVQADLRVLDLAPNFWNAYLNWGRAMSLQGKYDSAVTLFKIARVMSPYDATLLTDLGYAYVQMGRFRDAETAWLQARRNGPQLIQSGRLLLGMYAKRREAAKYRQLLLELSESAEAPADILDKRVQLELREGSSEQAARVLRRAIQSGLDSSRVTYYLTEYPSLKEHLNRDR